MIVDFLNSFMKLFPTIPNSSVLMKMNHMLSESSRRVEYYEIAHGRKICPEIIIYNVIFIATFKRFNASKIFEKFM